MDTDPEERFDRLTRLVSDILQVPIALVSLVDEDRQWFKSRVGLEATQTSRASSFCAHAILGDRVFVVEDASQDPRFADNPLVVGDPDIRFYAGVPIREATGHSIGALCAIDRRPRTLSASQERALQDLAALVERELAASSLADVYELLREREARLAEAQAELEASRVEERRAQARYEKLVANSSDIIVVLDAERRVRYASPAGEAMGWRAGDLPSIFDALHPDDAALAISALDEVIAGRRAPDQPVTFRIRTAQGHWRSLEARGVDLTDDPDVAGVVVTTRDVTEREQLQARLAHAAGHDPLTDLPNRGYLLDHLASALARAERHGGRVVVCFLDLDRFKPVNDQHGHAVGDEVLVQVAARLRDCIRLGDLAARLGGDEFVVVSEEQAGQGEGEGVTLARRIGEQLAPRYVTSAGPVVCTATVGTAVSQPGDAASALLRRADADLYAHKRPR